MNSLKVSWTITAVLAVALVFGGYKFITGEVAEKADDGRAAILMTAPERDMVLGEMRVFLEAVQTIVEALAQDDISTAAAAAISVGMGSTGNEPASLVAKLPLEFKTLGMGTHAAFDDLAMEGTDMGNSKIMLAQLGELMLRCTLCHDAYRFDVEPEQD